MIIFDEAAQSFYRALMWAGSWWCHQLPARSPRLWGAQLPLCWRCTGILIGTLMLLGWLLWKKRVPPLPLSFTLALLLPLDVLHAAVYGGQGDNTRRLLTGVLWGIFGTSLFLRFIKHAAAWMSPSKTARADVKPTTLV